MDDQEYLKKIGVRITQLRETLGLSVQELADKANLTRMHLYRLEAGKNPAGILVLKRIATALGIELSMLLKVE